MHSTHSREARNAAPFILPRHNDITSPAPTTNGGPIDKVSAGLVSRGEYIVAAVATTAECQL